MVVENKRCGVNGGLVQQTVKTDMVKREVEIETLGECVDEIDKLAELIGEMQLKQEDQSCVHALNKLHLHVFHVIVLRVSMTMIIIGRVRSL
ncbi:hypothetical protein Tco_0073575 [Tanacetum coccineum]